MNSPSIHRDADGLSHLLKFLDLFRTEAASEHLKETLPALLAKKGEWNAAERELLKSAYEEAALFLEGRAAVSGFGDELLKLQRGLYRELEHIYSLDGVDRRHHFLIVIPVADRPVMLRRCIDSLIGQCEDFGYGGRGNASGKETLFSKMRLFLLDDSKEDVHRKSVKETASYAERCGLRTSYVGIAEQAALIEQVRALEGDRASSVMEGKNPPVPTRGLRS